MLFNLDFTNSSILSYFFLFFLIIDLYFLICEAIAQFFNPVTELVIPTGIPSKEAKVEIEIHTVIVKAKIRKYSIFILLYFFKKIFSCFIYILQSKFLTNILITLYFQLNQEFLDLNWFFFIKYFSIFICTHTANNRKN